MKIVAVEPVPLGYREPNDHDGLRHVCLVRVTSDDGLAGWGEAVTIWPEATRATAEIVRGLAEPLIGRDPRDTAALWQAVREHTWWYGIGGIATFAHAAIDMALWDLKGRATGQRVLDLLGGPVHKDGLPAVVSCHAARADLRAGADEMAGWVAAERAGGIKVGFGKRGAARLGFEHDRDVEFVRTLRAALGPRPHIMIDLGVRNRWTVFTVIGDAVNTAARVEAATRTTGDDALITGETRSRLTVGHDLWTRRQTIMLKGKGDHVALYGPALAG